jgi:hypothetical protein
MTQADQRELHSIFVCGVEVQCFLGDGIIDVLPDGVAALTVDNLIDGFVEHLGKSAEEISDLLAIYEVVDDLSLYFHDLPDGSIEFETASTAGFMLPPSEFLELAEAALWKINCGNFRVSPDDGFSFMDSKPFVVYHFNAPRDILLGLVVDAVRSIDHAARFPMPRQVSPRTILGLLANDRASALLGLRESDWLDAKSGAYDFRVHKDAARVSLAQDVARFANSEHGGILLLGFATRFEQGGETLASIVPMSFDAGVIDSYRKTVDERVYPPVEGLEIQRFPVEGGEVVAITVPPQPESNKPYLVQGGILDGGKYDGGVISIVRRRGDGSIPIRAAAVHALLAAGRAALLGKEVLVDPDASSSAASQVPTPFLGTAVGEPSEG